MVDIEPYKQIQKTNIQEHNDLVGKINQIIDVVNTTNLESIGIKFNSIDSEISTIKATDSLQWVDIEKLKTNDPKQDATLNQHTEEIKGLTESLVSNVSIVDGYNTGTFKVRIDREKAVSIDSNEYALESPVSIELIQGTGPSMFKCQITLSDGRTLVSNDFVFTTEYIGQDIYISSFTFKAGNVDGTISADIGLSNGVTIEANNFVIPTPPTVANAINDLNTRVQSLEDTTVSDVRITNIETKNAEQDSAIESINNDISFINTELDNIGGRIVIRDYQSMISEMGIIPINIPITATLPASDPYQIARYNSIIEDGDTILALNGKMYYCNFNTETVNTGQYPFYKALSGEEITPIQNFFVGKTIMAFNISKNTLNTSSPITVRLHNDDNTVSLSVRLGVTKNVIQNIALVSLYSKTANADTVLTNISIDNNNVCFISSLTNVKVTKVA